MKLKYYLRGLGLGILVTALVLGIAGRQGNSQMSDEEIKARAEELGMVDNSNLTLAQLQNSTSSGAVNETKETQKQEEGLVSESTNGQEQSEQNAEQETEPTSTQEQSEQNAEQVASTETAPTVVSITIAGGASSNTVSKSLEAAGLVEDAKEYDDYLCDNGYSRLIRIGTFEIPSGATWEEIAKIITGKQ